MRPAEGIAVGGNVMSGPFLSQPSSLEPFHKRHRRWLIGWGSAAALFVAFMLNASNETGSQSDPGESTLEDRAPYAEVACEDFTREAGIRTDDGETSNITRSAMGNVYTVQMYEDDIRVGTCVVQATGTEEWTLVRISGL
jgi:hypothetical protein